MSKPLASRSTKEKSADGVERLPRDLAEPAISEGQAHVLDLQRKIGNRAVVNLIGPGSENPGFSRNSLRRKATSGNGTEGEERDVKRQLRLQTKLKISEPGDRFEQEADRVASQVIGKDEPVGQRSPHAHSSTMQRSVPNLSGPGIAPRIINGALSSPGYSLDSATREFFETRFGHDLGQARIHTDTRAMESARTLNAEAYTVGWDMVFGAGQYAPETSTGKRLLAHELTHVIQQTAAWGGAFSTTSSFASTAPPTATVARTIASKYSKIEDNLTYGILDWAITDAEAHEVLEILKALNPADLKDTIQKMESDGLVGRLLENITKKDEIAYAPLIQSIQLERGTKPVTKHIESLLSYGLLDWAITDEEAHLALETLKSLRPTPHRLKQVVTSIAEKQFQRLFEQLTDRDLAANKDFIAELRSIRATGMTRSDARIALEEYSLLDADERQKYFEKNYPTGLIANVLKALSPQDAVERYPREIRELLRQAEETETRKASGLSDEEMATLQAKYMEAKAEKRARAKIEKEMPKAEAPAAPTAVQKEEARKEIVKESSIERPTEAELKLLKKKDEEMVEWKARAAKVVKAIVAFAQAKYPELKVTESQFREGFEAIQRRGKRVFAMTGNAPDGTRQIIFGYAFVEAAEADPAYVMRTVVHELFGHPEYGFSEETYLMALYDAAAAKVEGYSQPVGRERQTEVDNFAYQGTEIYSHLRSIPYYTPVRPEDKGKNLVSTNPKEAVQFRIGLIKKNWDPKVAPALVRGLFVRFRLDPRITPEALDAFKDGVKSVFKDGAEVILK